MTPATQDLIRRTIVTSKTSEGLERAIELALREQDKRTRHACADAIIDLSLDDFGNARVAAATMQARAADVCMTAYSV